MVHIGSKCETQRVSRFSSEKYSSTAHAYVYVFITTKTKIAGPTRPHSVSSHYRDYCAFYALNVFSLVKRLQLILEISTAYSYLLADNCYNSNRQQITD